MLCWKLLETNSVSVDDNGYISCTYDMVIAFQKLFDGNRESTGFDGGIGLLCYDKQVGSW